MNERTEKKLTDLSGMNRAVNEILKQAWERGHKYGNEEKKDVEERTIKGIAKLDENGEIKIELLRPQADEGAIEILTNYEKNACHDCILRPCSVPCRLLTALRYAIKYMKLGYERKGEWIRHISSIECSVCKEKFFSADEDENCQDYDPCSDYNFNYCPNCGADMREGGAEE